ncbi:MAG: helix-turn-helix domain-containing protein [Pseudomonadota bacterium]
MSATGRHLSPDEVARLQAMLSAGMTPSAAAREMGCNRKTAARHARAMASGDAPAAQPAAAAGAFKIGGSPADRRIVALEDEVRRLTRELRAAHRDGLDEEAVRAILGRISTAPEDPPDWLISPPRGRGKGAPEVPMTIWSDWHLAENVSREETFGFGGYDLETGEARVRRLVESTINICRNHGPGRYPGIIINALGDFVSGGLHPELAKTDLEESIPAALRCRDILVWALERMISEFGRVFVPCAAGNHGRATLKPEFKRYVFKNYDWLIYQLLARHFEGRKEIVFSIPSANEVRYQVYALRFLALHGDMLGVKGGDGIIGAIGPIMRGEIKTRGQAAASGREFDMLLMGHWHQELWLPRAIVANSLKGFDEYAKNALRAAPSEPSQPLWFVHPRRGITSRWSVKVDPAPAAAGQEWVSWEKAA